MTPLPPQSMGSPNAPQRQDNCSNEIQDAQRLTKIPVPSFRFNLACGRRFGLHSLRLQNLIDEKQICKQCADVDRGIQVVDQLRAEGSLGKNNLDGGKRVTSVPIEHGEKGVVGFGRLQVSLFYCRRISLGEPGKRFDSAMQIVAHFPTGPAPLITIEPLAGVGEHEFVAFLDGGATSAYFVGRHLGRDSL